MRDCLGEIGGDRAAEAPGWCKYHALVMPFFARESAAEPTKVLTVDS